MSKQAKDTTTERGISRETLREMLTPGDTVYTVLRSVSASGMSRDVSVVIVDKADGALRNITVYVARALGYTLRDVRGNWAVRLQGCGMDMGLALVYELGRVLWPDGFGVKGTYPNGSIGRPISRAMAETAVSIGAKFYGRNGDTSGWDTDGGYALRQEWI